MSKCAGESFGASVIVKHTTASSLHRNDCEVVERQECRHGRSRSTSTRLQKAGGDSKFAVVDGAPKALDFRAVELSWRVVLEAASSSGANPRTCRGADSGFPCFSAEGGTRGGRG